MRRRKEIRNCALTAEQEKSHLSGFVTDKDAREIEKNFPGIMNLYSHTEPKPKTFLELEWVYMGRIKIH